MLKSNFEIQLKRRFIIEPGRSETAGNYVFSDSLSKTKVGDVYVDVEVSGHDGR